MTQQPEEVRPGALIYKGKCESILPSLPDSSVHAIVTDPPAGIKFMGKDWDHDKGGRDQWVAWMTGVALECFRVLKPGGHALVWALPRTSHWTATAWEDAGFEVRDRVAHLFGSGYPKSHDIGKAIDKQAGVERVRTGRKRTAADGTEVHIHGKHTKAEGYQRSWMDLPEEEQNTVWETLPATEEAKKWDGWGTTLKPAVEDWWLFRKPIESDLTVAANVIKHGTGALNIRACLVEGEAVPINKLKAWSGFGQLESPEYETVMNEQGRWPANLIHDGSPEVLSIFPQTSSGKPVGKKHKSDNNTYGEFDGHDMPISGYGDSGSAARFFYCAKPSKTERHFGLDGLEAEDPASVTDFRPTLKSNPENWAETESPYMRTTKKKNNHPTVKSVSLMTFLVKLITPPGGVVLDAFMGSGTTGVACVQLGRPFVGIEEEERSFRISRLRIKAAQPPLFTE